MKSSLLLVVVSLILLVLPATSQTVKKAPGVFDTELTYVDVLSARDTTVSSDLIERINPSVLSQDKERYITPFSEEAQRIVVHAFIVKERTRHSSGGVIVNVALSSREILGYSEIARSRSAQEIGIDPLDLDIANRAEDEPDVYIDKWLAWRKKKLLSLVRKIALSYKANFKTRRIYICGNADYYESTWFNDLRSGQDWKTWLGTGLFDGVLLRGNWGERSGSLKAFQIAKRTLQNSNFPPARGDRASSVIYPLLENTPKSGAYNTQCTNILKYVPDLDGVFARSDSSTKYKKFIDFKSSLTLPKYRVLHTGELIDQWPLQSLDGRYVDLDSTSNQRELALLLCPDGIDDNASLFLNRMTSKNRQLYVVAPVATPKIKTLSKDSKSFLIDKNKTLLNLYSGKKTLLLFDSAGFLRSINRAPSPYSVTGTTSRMIQVGKPAPDFLMTDMNGKSRRLSSLKGKKNLLLTFFPKCFTGGCTNHLSSINQNLSDFYKNDTEVWAVSIDSGDAQRDFAAMWSLKFPIIPDINRNLCLLYGAAKDTHQLADRMSVFIDKNGIVKWVDKDIHVSTHGLDLLKRIKS